MQRPLAVPFLAALLAPFASVSAQSEDAARLIPANATILVRVESARALNEFVHAFASLGEEAAGYDLERMLNGMRKDAAEDPDGGIALDPGLPLYLAICLDPASGSGMTLVLPVTNGRPFRLVEEYSGPTTNVTLGRYSGSSSVKGYAAGAPSALVAELPAGLVSAHLDLKAILALYRPLIDTGLRQAEASLDHIDADQMPFDIEPMLEAYLTGVRNVLDAAEALDLRLEQRGDEVGFQLDFRAAAGSKLDGWAAGPSADLAPLAGLVGPASSIQMLFNRGFVEYMKPFEELIDSALAIYPEPLRSDLGTMVAAQLELGALLQPGMAVGGDFTSQGMHLVYALRSAQPDEFFTGLEKTLVELDHPGGMFHLGPVERWTVEGLEARVHPLTIDYSALETMLEELEPARAQTDFPEYQRLLETLYGRDLRLVLAASGNAMLLCLGSDEAVLKSDLTRLRSPAAPSAGVQRLLQRIPPDSVGLAYHFDFGQTMSQMLEALSAILPTPGMVLPKVGASFDFWGSVRGRTWTGGLTLSVQELLDFAQSLQALEKR